MQKENILAKWVERDKSDEPGVQSGNNLFI